MRPATTFVVAEVVDEDEHINVVTTGPEPLKTSVRIHVCGEEFEGRGSEVTLFLGREDTKAGGPRPGPLGDSVVVGVDGGWEGADPLEVWESEVHPWADAWSCNWGPWIYISGYSFLKAVPGEGTRYKVDFVSRYLTLTVPNSAWENWRSSGASQVNRKERTVPDGTVGGPSRNLALGVSDNTAQARIGSLKRVRHPCVRPKRCR